MIPTIDITKGAVLTMNAALDPDEEQLDIEDEMAEDEDEDDFWLGKLGDFLTPCRPVYRTSSTDGQDKKDTDAKPTSKRPKKAPKTEAKPVIQTDVKPKRQAARAAVAAVAAAADPDPDPPAASLLKKSRKKGGKAGAAGGHRKCPLCGVEADDLNKHVKQAHKVDGVVCPHCSKILAKNCTLSRHIEQVHFNLQIHKPAKCDQCDKVFSKKGHLDRHIKTIHLGLKEQSNPCPHCGKVFSTKSSLEPHIMMVHQGLRKKCPECGKVLSDLWKHMRTMHGQYRRRAKISKEEAISKNLVPNTDGRVDVSDIESAKHVPSFTAEVDSPHSIEYVQVPEADTAKTSSNRRRRHNDSDDDDDDENKPSRRKSEAPVKVRMPFRNRRNVRKDSESSDSKTDDEDDE